MATDWVDDAEMSPEETRARFQAMKPIRARGPYTEDERAARTPRWSRNRVESSATAGVSVRKDAGVGGFEHTRTVSTFGVLLAR